MNKNWDDQKFEDMLSSLRDQQIEDPPSRLWYKISDTIQQKQEKTAWHFLTSPLSVRLSTGLAVCLVVVLSMAGVSEWQMRSEVNSHLDQMFLSSSIELDSSEDLMDFDLL